MCLEVDRVGPWNTQPLSRHIFHRHTSNSVHCFPYILQPLFTLLGYNTRLHGVPSAWVFVSGMLAEAKVSPSFLKTPLILRDHVPSSSFWGWMPPVSETRVSPLFEVRVPPVLIEACCLLSKPTCLRFSRPSLPPLRVSYLQLKRAS